MDARYYVIFLDDYSKFLWLFPIKLEFDVEHVFFFNFNITSKNTLNKKLKPSNLIGVVSIVNSTIILRKMVFPIVYYVLILTNR
jgi:hypothetical protein